MKKNNKASEFKVYAVTISDKVYFGVARDIESVKAYLDNLDMETYQYSFFSSSRNYKIEEVSKDKVKLEFSFENAGFPIITAINEDGSLGIGLRHKFYLSKS